MITDYERDVLTSLLTLQKDMSMVRDHLSRLNGSVAKQEERLQITERAIAARAAADIERDASGEKWDKRILPLVMLVIGAAITWIVAHIK